MTDWNERKTKSLSNVPLWLEKAVEDYQHKFGFQSWSAAVLEIIACYLNQEHGDIRFGDADFENAMMDRLEAEEKNWSQLTNPLEGLLREMVAPPQHGGDRKSGE
jgi:hypothetical protein